MNIKNEISSYFDTLSYTLSRIDKNEILLFIEVMLYAYQNDKNIFVFGNGGSASAASHFACDINKGISDDYIKSFKVIPLVDNIATILAYANDVSYDEIFVRQLKTFLNKGDVVIGISGSGNSPNIIKAIEYANRMNAVSVGITGYSGGKLREISKYSINTNINDMQISEDVHLIIIHLTMKILSKIFLLNKNADFDKLEAYKQFI